MMGSCIIFCAGDFHGLLQPVTPEDYVIAADGGLRHCASLGLTPQEVLGDFDSLGYVPEGAQVFPVEKDDTDSMLAVRRGLELGYRDFLIYGGMDGQRLDHTVANLQTLKYLSDHDGCGTLVGKTQCATVIRDGSLRFPAVAEGIVSVFALGADAKGVTIRGLQYPLEDGLLTAGHPLGVSNHFVGKSSEISVKDGCLLVFYPREVMPC